jgi:hypothetical protein
MNNPAIYKIQKNRIFFVFVIFCLMTTSLVIAKTKKTNKTPTPVSTTSNQPAMQKALRFYVYEKSTDVVNDVTGIFDNEAQKITLKCELKNQTGKEIHGVRGTLRFTTQFHETVADVSIESTAAIAPGQVIGVNWNVPPDRLTAAAFENLKKTELKDLRQVWIPTMIAFTDGTVLK